tara:strand:+ start:286 stop:612 length:327 start_codon:yes stop_codon:yes gene_type:complete
MIKVSNSAKEQIRGLIIQDKLDDSYFLRASVAGGGCSGLSYDMSFDNKINDKDKVFIDNDTKIVVDMKSLLYLIDSTLDFSDGLNGKGFQFINPNATRTCGCGESFSV